MKISTFKIPLIAGLLVACSFSVHAQPRAASAHVVSYKAAQNDFQAHLFKMASERIKSSGLFMLNDVRESLRGFINDGVKHMYHDGLNDEERRASAENFIERYVSVMIDDAQKRGSSRLDMISFRNAHNMSCPKTPFCM